MTGDRSRLALPTAPPTDYRSGMRDHTLLAVLLLASFLPAQTVEPRADPAAEPRVRLEGLVVDPQQRPLPGALVTAEVDGELVGRTLADGSGAFVLGKLPPRLVVVRAATSTPDVGGVWVDLLGVTRSFARIVAMPARVVRGTVRDEQGAPVAGAWVVAAPCDDATTAFASCCVQSDAAGAYVLTHVPIGPALVRAWATGCDAFEGSVDGCDAKVLDAEVTRDAGQVHEFSLLDGTPEQVAAGVLVVAAFHNGWPTPLPGPLRRIRANEEGKWIVAGWPYSDDLHVKLEVPGASIFPVLRSAFAGRGGVRSNFWIADATTSVQGRLVGAAPGGRLLLLQPCDANAMPMLSRCIGRSGVDGTFDFPSPVDRGDRFALRLVAEDATAGTAAPEHGAPERSWYVGTMDSRPHTVVLRPARSIRLRVFDSGGAPAAGARVSVYEAGFARQLPGGDLKLVSTGSPLAHGCSDRDGNVRIDGLDLTAGETLACLVCAADGIGEKQFEVPEVASIELGRLDLVEAATLHVQVVGEGGPVPGARVTCQQASLPWLPAQTMVTDRTGKAVAAGLLPTAHILRPVAAGAGWRQRILSPGPNDVEIR